MLKCVNITFETLRSGQVRKFTDAVTEYRVTIRGAVPDAEYVKKLLHAHHHTAFADNYGMAENLSPYLDSICEVTEPGSGVWNAIIIHPYSD